MNRKHRGVRAVSLLGVPLALSSCVFTPEGPEGLALYNDSGEDLVITIAETGREISLD